MKKLLILSSMFAITTLIACGGSDEKKSDTATGEAPKSMVDNAGSGDYDPTRGEGKWTAENVNASGAVDAAKAAEGEKISGVKCFSCHKTTDEKLVGPGWKDVTTRHKPEWIMNFITNPDPMITKDPKMQAQLEICLVRMPNQSLTDDDARAILEYMRKINDAK